MNEEEIKELAKDVELILGGNYKIDTDLSSMIDDVLDEIKKDPKNSFLKKLVTNLCNQRIYINVQSVLLLENREDKKEMLEEMKVLLKNRMTKAEEVAKYISSLE